MTQHPSEMDAIRKGILPPLIRRLRYRAWASPMRLLPAATSKGYREVLLLQAICWDCRKIILNQSFKQVAGDSNSDG